MPALPENSRNYMNFCC